MQKWKVPRTPARQGEVCPDHPRRAGSIRSILPWALALAGTITNGGALAGPYTQPGHTISEMVAWATSVESLDRGPMDIAKPDDGDASYGAESDVLGPASTDTLDVLSLGDGGEIELGLASGIGDGPGNDFAVFENGFYTELGLFAEFAFVEVSSNGMDFARFDAISLPTHLVPGGAEVDPTDYYNLAGDQPIGLGTGFDLSELSDHKLVQSGLLDLDHVTHVRVVDVIGDGSKEDAYMNPVYDPYPTDSLTSGFDLNAVGVIHVPEPGLLGGLLSGLLALLGVGRARRRAHRPTLLALAAGVSLSLSSGVQAGPLVDFEDLGLAPESFITGEDGGDFTSGGFTFGAGYRADWDYAWGFYASTTTDSETPGFTNQYSAYPDGITGNGAGGSSTYGVFYQDSFQDEKRMVLDDIAVLQSAMIANTTYAYLSMRDGDDIGKKFGGDDGTDEDWFLLTVTGYDESDQVTGTTELYLADYRSSDPIDDYILSEWTELDLSVLGAVKSLGFGLTSSDVGDFGMNTPAYLAIDDILVPEPGTALLLAVGLVGLGAARRQSPGR